MESDNMHTPKSKRGFASMDAEKQKLIASQGGRAAHQKGTAHQWSHDEAVTAGRKGGQFKKRVDRDDMPLL